MNPERESLVSLREKAALWIAPWLFVPYREAREDAFRDLALVAYGSRDAVWTSPTVLVKTALRETKERAYSEVRETLHRGL